MPVGKVGRLVGVDGKGVASTKDVVVTTTVAGLWSINFISP